MATSENMWKHSTALERLHSHFFKADIFLEVRRHWPFGRKEKVGQSKPPL